MGKIARLLKSIRAEELATETPGVMTPSHSPTRSKNSNSTQS